jgi:3-deoxy-manno-octulosonate cytidylyltransferase (CMP-KDO synthetase)
MRNETVVIIPARYASSRLPGKPLIQIAGKPLIQWVYERALGISRAREVLIVTDHRQIEAVAKTFHANVMMSPSDIQSGSERVGFAARNMEADIVVNLQGDEPFIPVDALNSAIDMLQENPQLNISTIACRLRSEDEWRNPSVVKVLVDKSMNAIYFSRATIPSFRDKSFHPLPQLLKHIGAYVFRKDFLLQFVTWEQSSFEKAEKLEQLRILENGHKIGVVESEKSSFGVDTPEDVAYIEKRIKERGINL